MTDRPSAPFPATMFFADFNIHSKYSRGTHPDMEIPTLAKTAKTKGLSLLGTGDFTQAQWFVELQKFLKPAGKGVFEFDGVHFLLTTELVCAYSRGGRDYRINNLIFAPSFAVADKVGHALEKYGNVETEARPSIKLTPEDLVKALMELSPDVLVVPAHAWGLHHSLFSPTFGYESLAEAYGIMAGEVRVLETGLCADPALLAGWPDLAGRTLISNSDAHAPAQLGREANMFNCALDYREILAAMKEGDRKKFLGTVESFPEEDKFFASGHRACGWTAGDSTASKPDVCGVCAKPYAEGVRDRVRQKAGAKNGAGTAAFARILPLADVIADALSVQPDADSVKKRYAEVTSQAGAELDILVRWGEAELQAKLPGRLAEAVLALRRGELTVAPGYDGNPGRVRVRLPKASQDQLKLFG